MDKQPLFFMDGTCPKCHRMCGNGGVGDVLRCRCGWAGKIDAYDAKLIAEIFAKHQALNAVLKEVSNHK